MTLQASWIEPLLRSALEEYCKSGKQGTTFESSDFAYSYEPRRFRIRPLRKQLRALKPIELPGSHCTPEQLVTDGVHALPPKFLRIDKTPPKQANADVIWATDALEFRISDYSNPPWLELCVLSYTEVNKTDLGSCALTSKPTRLAKVESIRTLLQDATGQERTTSTLDERRDSIMSDDEGSVVSQARFQTQAVPALASRTGSQVTSSILSQQPHHESRAPSVDIPPQQGRPRTLSADKKDVRGGPHVQNNQPFTRPEPVQKAIPLPVQAIPLPVQRHFRCWRAESMAGRYVPRRVTKISKSQTSLLDSGNSYFPPLAGHDLRLGTIPLDLLNAFTVEADRQALQPDSGPVPASESNRTEQQVEQADTGQGTEEDNFASLGSSQQVSSDAWPDSPVPLGRGLGLPPDSPVGLSSDVLGSKPPPNTESRLIAANPVCSARRSNITTQLEKVQVKRTPYPGNFASRLVPDSESRILSTYDDLAVDLAVKRQIPGESDRVKRRASDEVSQKEVKRPKLVSRGHGTSEDDPDYAQVLQNNREKRSQELSRLTNNKALRRTPSSTVSFNAASRRQSRSDLAQTVSTPITVPSEHEPNRQDLFEQYRAAYADYGAHFRVFDNACRLLQRLYKSQRRPHQSLFDDFVYHHHHSYRPYLLRIADSSDGDPVPYVDFYNDYIVTPQHRLMIITQDALYEEGVLPEAVNMDASQRSSVRSWVEQVRAGSPELGTPDVPPDLDRSPELEPPVRAGAPLVTVTPRSWRPPTPPAPAPTPTPTSTQHTSIAQNDPSPATQRAPAVIDAAPLRKRKSASSFVASLKKPDEKWWKHANTPFKRFVEQLSQVHSVKVENAVSLASRPG